MQFLTDSIQLASFQLNAGDQDGIRGMLKRVVHYRRCRPVLSEPGPDGKLVHYSASGLYEEVMCLGDGLLAAGLGEAHIAVVSGNCCRYFTLLLSVLCGTSVLVPIDAQAPLPLLENLLERSDADAVFCDPTSLPRVLEAKRHCPRLKTVITLEGKADGADLSYDALLAAGRTRTPRTFSDIRPDPDTLAVILFSSGTTGANKGVMLSRANITSDVLSVMHVLRRDEGMRCMSLIPMHHAACISFTLAAFSVGRRSFFCSDVRTGMGYMDRYRPQRILAVPLIIESFYRQINAAARKAGRRKPSRRTIRQLFGGSLQVIVSGGSGLHPELIREMAGLGISIRNIYGTTECSPVISINHDTRHDPLTVGRPVSGLEIRLDNPDGEGVGTLCVRGKKVAMGYYKDPEATRAVFGPDGFFNTGDSVRLTADGRIEHLGRKANTLVLPNGENIYPQEIEHLIISRMEDVSEAVVYTARLSLGKATREVLCAGLYVPDPARRADRARIAESLRQVNRDLPAYKRIDYIELPDTAYPRTTSLKIRRTALPKTCSGDGILLTQ